MHFHAHHRSHEGLDHREHSEGNGDGERDKKDEGINMNKYLFPYHLEKIHDTPSSSNWNSSNEIDKIYLESKDKDNSKDNSRNSSTMKSRSFADLAEVFGFTNNLARPQSKGNGILPRPHSSANLERRTSLAYTKRHFVPHHLPTNVIIGILSFCSDDTLFNCLTASRFFFNLSGTILYKDLSFESPKDIWEKLRGSTLLYENTTGKISIGRRRFKDRLLRHTTEVTLHSHGDDDNQDDNDDDDDTNQDKEGEVEEGDDYFGNFSKRLSILSHTHSRNSSSSSLFSFGGVNKRSIPSTPVITPPILHQYDTCPPVPLNGVMSRIKTLRIILADSFDYHLLFCPRFGSACPLLEGLELDKLIIIGARSPLVVLPTAFPSTTIHSTINTPNSPNSHTPPFNGGSGTAKIKSTGGLPIGLSELTIVLPTGRSYDSKDYEGYHHIFHHKQTLDTIQKLTIVFLTGINSNSSSSNSISVSARRNHYQYTCQDEDPGNQDPLWQIAFYSSREYSSSSNWTSYLCLAEDIVKSILSVPLDCEVEVVGIENLDGELLNMGGGFGLGFTKASKSRERVFGIMKDRIQRQIEVLLKAKNKENQIYAKINMLRFTELKKWLIEDGREELGDKGFEELAKEGWKEYR